MAIFSYKGTDYEFPDTWTDEQALAAIRTDTGEQQGAQPSPEQQPGPVLFRSQQQNTAFLKNVAAPTMLGNLFGAQQGGMADAYLGASERTGRVIGGVAGNMASDVGAALMPVLGGIGRGIGWGLGKIGAPDEEIKAAGKKVYNKLGDIARDVDESRLGQLYSMGMEDPAVRANAMAGRGFAEGVNTFGGLGIGGALGKAGATTLENTTTKPISRYVGGKLVEAGNKGLEETYKITTPIAKQAGSTKYKGVQKIIGWMNDFKLEGRPKVVAKKAQDIIDEQDNIADNAMNNYIKSNPTDQIHTNKIFGELWTDLNAGNVPGTAIAGEVAQDAAMKQITEMLTKKGLTGNLTPDKIPALKSALKEEIGLFTKGAVTPETNLLKKIGDEYYRRLKVSLEDKIPEIADPNNNIHKLIVIKNAAEDAAQRIGNKYDIGLMDLIPSLGIGIGAGAATGGDIGLVGAGALAGGALLAKKTLGGGRLAAGQIKLGRALKKYGQSGETTIGDIGKQKPGTATLGGLGLTGYGAINSKKRK